MHVCTRTLSPYNDWPSDKPAGSSSPGQWNLLEFQGKLLRARFSSDSDHLDTISTLPASKMLPVHDLIISHYTLEAHFIDQKTGSLRLQKHPGPHREEKRTIPHGLE